LDSHKQCIHSDTRPHLCPYCGKQFKLDMVQLS